RTRCVRANVRNSTILRLSTPTNECAFIHHSPFSHQHLFYYFCRFSHLCSWFTNDESWHRTSKCCEIWLGSSACFISDCLACIWWFRSDSNDHYCQRLSARSRLFIHVSLHLEGISVRKKTKEKRTTFSI